MEEFEDLIKDIIADKEFQKIALIEHHEGTRLEHSLQVAKRAYNFAKKHNLDYKAVARAGLLHDFFGSYDDEPTLLRKINLICNHGMIAKQNAMRFGLNEKEANIIASHMFPLGKEFPKSKEAWLVTAIDKTSATKEWVQNFKWRHVVQIMTGILFFRIIL